MKPEPKIKKKSPWLLYVKIAVVVTVVVFLVLAVRQFDMQSLLDSIRQIPVWSVALLFAAQIVTQLLINTQWHQIAKNFKSPISYSQMLYINAQAELIHIAPGGHVGCDVFRAVQINKGGNCTGEQSAAVVAIQKLFSLSAFFTISLVSIGVFIGRVPWLQGTGFQFLLYGLLLLILILLGCIFIMPHKMAVVLSKKWQKPPRFKWTGKLRGFALVSLEHIVYLRKHPKLMLGLAILALSIWTLYPLKMYLLATQLIPDINIIYVAAATFLSYTVAMIPIFPGGLGGFEGTMTALLLFIGFAQGGAIVITVLFRFATFWFVVLMSLIFMAFYRMFKKMFKKTPA